MSHTNVHLAALLILMHRRLKNRLKALAKAIKIKSYYQQVIQKKLLKNIIDFRKGSLQADL